MKSYKLPILGIGLMLLMASCKKEDVRQSNSKDSTSGASSKTQWSSLSAWGNSTTENVTTYFSKLTDSSVTSEVVNNGLVLVYKKSGSDIQLLPFQERDSKTYWYYQVAKGSIRINSDNNDGQNLAAPTFTYFVVTPQQLSNLEAKGKTKFDLLQLSLDEATSLLK
jgi:hypothetical protein